MAVIYKVTVEPGKKKKSFRVTWFCPGTNKKESFAGAAEGISDQVIDWQKQKPGQQMALGEKIFDFLDGANRCLQRALDEGTKQGEIPQLYLCACIETADWPFELLALQGNYLLPNRLHLARCVTDWGVEKKREPEDRPLKLLFMASSALDVQPELDFEKEEETIFRITENLLIDMEVEDSGSLEGLREHLQDERYDVVHLSGHADIDKQGRPFFVMEDETGARRDVSPGELWQEALVDNPPRLLFLSGCRTGQAPEKSGSGTEIPDKAALSFARYLVEKHNLPAILGWGRPVSDLQATAAEQVIYRELSRGKSILHGVQRARDELVNHFAASPYPA